MLFQHVSGCSGFAFKAAVFREGDADCLSIDAEGTRFVAGGVLGRLALGDAAAPPILPSS